MLTGSSVDSRILSDQTYRKLLLDFDYLYIKNSKFDTVQQRSRAKAVSEFALENGKLIRGNRLISFSQELNLHLIRIKLKEFPEIEEWECCHELINDDGFFRKNWNQENLNATFTAAKEFNPQSKLFYADYYRDTRKWEKTYEVLYLALDRGVPVDGLSVQLMSSIKPPIDGNPLTLDIETAMKWMKRIKEDFNITLIAPETVVWQPVRRNGFQNIDRALRSCCDFRRDKRESLRNVANLLLAAWDLELLQKIGYELIIKMCQEVGCDMIGFWSAFDATPWNWDIRNQCKAGLWDEQYRPKKAASILSLF